MRVETRLFEHPGQVPGGLIFLPGKVLRVPAGIFFSPGWNIPVHLMTGVAETGRGFPRWHNFPPGISPLGFVFTGVGTTPALSRDVFGVSFGIGKCPGVTIKQLQETENSAH